MIGQEEPSFAGLYIDGDNQIVAAFADSLRLSAGRAVIARHLASGGLGLPRSYRRRPIVVVQVGYSFQQLSDWRDKVYSTLLGKNGVIMDDLDEAINKVTIRLDAGVAGARESLLQQLDVLDIPRAAVNIELGGGIRPAAGRRALLAPTAATQSAADTIGGGLEIAAYFPNTNTDGGQATIGLVVDRNDTRGFLGASHESLREYSFDTTYYYQSNRADGNYIGKEAVDPSAFLDVNGRIARYSDATFNTLDGTSCTGASPTGCNRRGVILKLYNRVPGASGNLAATTDSQKWIYVTQGETQISTTGLTVDKVGKTTGWTYGAIIHTCSDIHQTTGVDVLCQAEANAYGGTGDSGGPVFWYDGANAAMFYGLTSGLDCSSCTFATSIFFSPYTAIKSDLGGTFNIVSDITLTSPALSASLNTYPTFSWTASVGTNTYNSTTYYVERYAYDASTATSYTDEFNVGSSTSWTDTSGPPIQINSYYGTSQPGGCHYSWVRYYVYASNYPASSISQSAYFLGNYSSSCGG